MLLRSKQSTNDRGISDALAISMCIPRRYGLTPSEREKRSSMGKVRRFLLVIAVVALIGCGTKELRIQEYRVSPDAPDPAKPPEEFYTIGYGDSISVQVWKEPTLSGGAAVRPDGFVTLPLINEVQVVGLTTAQLRKLLEQKYKEFTVDPYVTVAIGGIASAEVFLISPGTGKNSVMSLKGTSPSCN